MLPTMIHTTGKPSPDVDDVDDTGPFEDDRLRLMFTCCHPALALESQVALTLRLVGGLTVEEIARGLLKSETALGQRITRAKAKVASAHIPYKVPSEEDLPERLDAVLAVLYLAFNEAYLPGGDQAPRADLSGEAIRLTRLLHQLLPDQPEATGLLALMLLTDSRRLSRVSADGELVTLAEQDRGGWDRPLIEEGHTLVRSLIAGGQPPGRYQLQAAINAVHCYAPDVRDTDWQQLSTLYDHLFALDPTPVVALNRAVVRAELDGPSVALAEVDGLGLHGYHAWHATRADLLRRLGRSADARALMTLPSNLPPTARRSCTSSAVGRALRHPKEKPGVRDIVPFSMWHTVPLSRALQPTAMTSRMMSAVSFASPTTISFSRERLSS